MSSTYAEPIARLQACLDEIAAVDPAYRSTSEKQDLLVGLAQVITRAQAEHSRVLAVADDIAETTGARSTAAWLADTTRDAHARLRADAALATALEQRWHDLAAAFSAGTVNLAQVRVIAEALAALPDDLGDDLLAKAETHLVEQAAQHGPRELRLLGARILSVLAPDIADQAEYDALLAAEDRASAATRLTLRRRGDGSTDVHARVPDHVAGRLRAYLDAFAAPRRRHLDTPFGPLEDSTPDELANLPRHRRQGIALVALLENTPTTSLPRHGGTATTLMVTIDHRTLTADLHQAGIAVTSTGDQITAGQARRLACHAGILPMVLGGDSEILDLGRESRLFKPYQRKAINARDQTCTEIDCTIPAAFCEAHHPTPWAAGGTTDVDTGTLLCPFHHHRAHHPGWTTRHHPNGKTSFTRRQ